MAKPHRTLPPSAILHPIWLVRFFPLAGLLLVASAMLLSRSNTLHSMCLGGGVGILIGATVFAWQVDDLTLKQQSQVPDVKPYSLR